MFKVVFSDLDGTLLLPDSTITKENIKAIKELEKNNIKFVVLSGRSYGQMKNVIDELLENNIKFSAIGTNGAELINDSGESTYFKFLEKEAIKEIVQKCDDMKLFYQIYTDKGSVTKKIENSYEEVRNLIESIVENKKYIDEIAKKVHKSMHEETDVVYDIETHLAQKYMNVTKIIIMSADNEKLEYISKSIDDICDVEITSSAKSTIEIGVNGINKGFAVKEYTKINNISLDEVMCIGDNYNDVPMLEIAGMSVVMGNASDEIKKYGKFITKSNLESGVAYAIDELILKNI